MCVGLWPVLSGESTLCWGAAHVAVAFCYATQLPTHAACGGHWFAAYTCQLVTSQLVIASPQIHFGTSVFFHVFARGGGISPGLLGPRTLGAATVKAVGCVIIVILWLLTGGL